MPLGYETKVPLCDVPDTDLIYDVSISEESGLQVPRRMVADAEEGRDIIVTVANAGPDVATGHVTVIGEDAAQVEVFNESQDFVIHAGGTYSNGNDPWLFSLDYATTVSWTATAYAEDDLNTGNNTVTATTKVMTTGVAVVAVPAITGRCCRQQITGATPPGRNGPGNAETLTTQGAGDRPPPSWQFDPAQPRAEEEIMKPDSHQSLFVALGAVAMAATAIGVSAARPTTFDWQVVVNNGFEIPDNPGRYYNSYNPPSVNADALVVFRARSTGQQQGPVSGIYIRDMATLAAINKIADRDTEVPQPNNTEYPLPGGQGATTLSTFNEFPSFPRIALTADAVATRGNHQPVWTYVIGTDPDTGEPVETRVGTTGAYVNLDAGHPLTSPLITGASLLGAVPAFSDIFAVPGVDPTTRFDVFPGAPAITNAGVIAFKGNYSVDDPASDDPEVTIGKTGVFYRKVIAADAGGDAAIELVANSDTPVPNPGNCEPGTTFGSTAPPSAAGGHMVFVGFDDEDDPTCGGVYRAPLSPSRELTTLVGLEDKVPGQGNETFTLLGEGLSYDGRFVGFWGAWGAATKTVRLYCPEEGNRDRRDFCNNVGEFDPDQIPGRHEQHLLRRR